MALVAVCIAVSLGELASAYSNSGIPAFYRGEPNESVGSLIRFQDWHPSKYLRFHYIRLCILDALVLSLSLGP